jgi:hypothetical protein
VKIDVRYQGTSKTPVIKWEVFADGMRIGFVKMGKSREWQAVDWVHRFIDSRSTRKEATSAVIEHYKQYLETASRRNLKAFREHAVRLSE